MRFSVKKIKLGMLLFIPLISIFLHWKIFQMDLVSIHVWRQTQTQNTIQNFCEEDFNIFNPRQNNRGNEDGILRMEFPIMQWIFAGVYKVLGNHLIISRLGSFLIGLFSILGIYFLAKNIFQNEIIALISAWCFNFSPTFFYHTVNPMPDNFALCCGIWGLAFFFLFIKKQKKSSLFLCGIFLSLASLAKLPFILFASVPFAYQFIFRKEISSFKNHLNFLIIYGLQIFPLLWYAWVIPTWAGNDVAKGMFVNEQSFADLFWIIWGNVTSTLPELLLNFAAVPFFVFGIYTFLKNKIYRKKLFPVFAFLLLLLSAYFLFEMNLIGLIHDYYLFPFLPLLFLMVGYGGFQIWKINSKMAKVFVLIALLIAPITAHLRIATRWNSEDVGFNKDFLIHKEKLQSAVPDDALCIVGNDISGHILFYYTDKKGWRFQKDELDEGMIQYFIKEGAEYLYSDSRKVDTIGKLQPFFEKKIIEKGSVRIFKLQSAK